MTTRSHVFVVREGKILALQQAGGLRWWELPGGHLELGEDGQDAAVRETFEETGLRIRRPVLLRTWNYRNSSGDEISCHAYVADAPVGDVRLSHEHSGYAWMHVDDYVERYCGEQIAALAPQYAHFLAEMRQNCALFRARHLARTEPR